MSGSRKQGRLTDITAANVAYYKGGTEVGAYFATPYHAMRLTISIELIRDWISARSTSFADAHVLDAGCGSLDSAQMLADLYGTVTAVDADETLAADPETRNLSIVHADLADGLPFEARSFDAIFAGEVIEHLFDPLQFLREAHRGLKSGGCIVVTTPNLATIQDRLWFFLGRSPRQVDSVHPYLRFHIRPFTASSLCHILTEAGFEVDAVSSNFWVWRFDNGKRIRSRALARLFPRLGGSLIVRAVKV